MVRLRKVIFHHLQPIRSMWLCLYLQRPCPPVCLSVFSCFLSILQCVGSFRAYECIDSSGSVYLTKSGVSYTHTQRQGREPISGHDEACSSAAFP